MIESGTLSAPSRLEAVTLGLDELDLLVNLLGIDELPVVLNATARFDSVTARDAAFDAARLTLADRGLVDAGAVHPDVAEWLQVLARPEWEVALRWYAPSDGNSAGSAPVRDGSSAGSAPVRDGSSAGSAPVDDISRLCLVHGATGSVLALRGPDSYVLQRAEHPAGELMLDAIGRQAPLDFGVVNAPTEQLVAALADCADAGSTARRLAGLGVADQDVVAVSAALAGCRERAEIVAIWHGDGRIEPVGGPVAVFDTDRGRIVATSSVSADGVAWSTLSPGSDARFRQAIDVLVGAVS
ncbi:ESX secretion-associated protein EspG [Rhodococcus sp. NPDC058514]|uniref:ESX secretion-associated protein EspG n=1 Tax=unclassified Rhodococcus (in: high G+C Gram-positive bacteria) TaxID=192944 RepID=UPI0036510857